jgi:thiamine pyrophosphokinase
MSDRTAFSILLAGDMTVTDRLSAQVSGSRAIAADGGMRHAAALGLMPELWVGDFDSAEASLQALWPDVMREPHPAAKNETDGAIAVEAALARGARALTLVGGLGGARSDHALSNITFACSLAERLPDGHLMLTTGAEEAWPLRAGRQVVDLPQGSLFSIIAFGDVAGLTIQGARYALQRFDLAFGTSRTISNIADGPVTVAFDSGRAVLLARPYDFSGT